MNTVETKTIVNLSTYYILPMLGLSMSSYGEDNFIKSQVTKYGQVVVFIKNTESAGEYYNHTEYVNDVEEDDTTMIIYNIPDRFLEDYQMFLESKYSKMSDFAKQSAYNYAAANQLKWKIPTGKYFNTEVDGKMVKKETFFNSSKLLALTLNWELREKMEKELDCKIPKGQELMSRLNKNLEIINLEE